VGHLSGGKVTTYVHIHPSSSHKFFFQYSKQKNLLWVDSLRRKRLDVCHQWWFQTGIVSEAVRNKILIHVIDSISTRRKLIWQWLRCFSGSVPLAGTTFSCLAFLFLIETKVLSKNFPWRKIENREFVAVAAYQKHFSYRTLKCFFVMWKEQKIR
jgi:hypothetical protein